MRQRLQMQRTLEFHHELELHKQASALMSEVPYPWRAENRDTADGFEDGSSPDSIDFYRVSTASDPSYRLELTYDGDGYGLWGIFYETTNSFLPLDEWNLVATFFEVEVLLPAAKATPELTYKFTPAYQAPEDWYKPETCKHLRALVAAKRLPCGWWSEPFGKSWLSFLECLFQESEGDGLPVELCTWLQLVQGWSDAEMLELRGESLAILSYIGMTAARTQTEITEVEVV